MKTPEMAFLTLIVWVVIEIPSAMARPVYCLNVKSLEAEADLVCAGDVVSVENRGKEHLSLREPNANGASFEADILLARFLVRSIFKGSTTNEIIIKCHRNLMAWIPGIAEGSFLVFLKKEGKDFVPVRESGFVLPISAEALREKSALNVEALLRATIAAGKRDTIRICADALSQFMSREAFYTYAKELAAGRDDLTRGVALLCLIERGHRDVVPLATAFAEKERYPDRQLRALAAEVSHVLGDIEEKDDRKGR